MPTYKAPVKDILFVRDELLDFESHYKTLRNAENCDAEIAQAVIEEAAKFCEEILAPLNRQGDIQGCKQNEHHVKTPDGFKEAYQQFVAGGWSALSHNEQYGGQGLPSSLGLVLSEMMGQANWSWSMYPGLSHGSMTMLEVHGTEEQKQTYLTKLISGHWTGTMCLTEAHCGTDLGLLKTKAIPEADGSYRISGTKIFISSGEHDMSDNILHIVLARLPDAPEGVKGISVFIVPKFLPDTHGEKGERNAVFCGSLEHKMGIHGNATCVMNFDDAKGFLIGEPHKGLNCMFTFMNAARLGTGLQGLAHGEIAYQGALAYVRDRLQGRGLNGAVYPEKAADPLLVHPDIRRMLLTIKSLTEGSRALVYFTARVVDAIERGSLNDEEKQKQELLLSFLTPIVKAFITETGFESANLGLQCFGGHGYIAEWGMEQNVRDSRISTIYEGTTGIQALDLLGRKVLLTQGESLKSMTKIIHKFCKKYSEHPSIQDLISQLDQLNQQWGQLTMGIGMKAIKNKDEVGASAYDYLMYSGYVCLAYFWADMARLAYEKLDNQVGDANFYQGKIDTAKFYFSRVLPRTLMHQKNIESGSDVLMNIKEECF